MRRKNVLWLGLALALVAQQAWAMDARKEVVSGGVLGVNTPAGLVLDSADSFINPAYLLDYPSMLGLEGSTPGKDFVTGFTFVDMAKLGLSGTLGLQVGRTFGMVNEFTALNTASATFVAVNTGIGGVPPTYTLTDLSTVKSFGLLYALPMGPNFQVGAALNMIGNSLKGKANPADPASADVSKSLGDTEIRLGAKLAMSKNFNGAVDLGINLPGYSYSYTIATPGISQKADFSAMNLDINARLAMGLSSTFDAVGLLGFGGTGGEIKLVPDTATPANNITLVKSTSKLYLCVGGLMHMKDTLAGLLLGFTSDAQNSEYKPQANPGNNQKTNPTTTYFPMLQLVAERNLANWFVVRGSLQYQSNGTSTSTTATGVTTTINSPATSTITTSLGASVVVDSFVLETVICKPLLFDGPYFIGGVGNGLNATLSLAYKF